MNFPLLDWSDVLSNLVTLAAAYLLALPVGWNQEHEERTAGVRTFPLVALASCGYVLIARKVFGGDAQSQARVLEGLMTGIGFIGGGAILKQGLSVQGTATAASVWNTGAIGASVAYGRYEIALVLSIINFATLRWLKPLKRVGKETIEAEGRSEERTSKSSE